MSTALKRVLTQDETPTTTPTEPKRARVEPITNVLPPSLKDVEDSMFDLLDERADDFYESYFADLYLQDVPAIKAAGSSHNCYRAFKAIHDGGVEEYSDEAMGEVSAEYELGSVESAFVSAVMAGLANDATEVIVGDLEELINEDDEGLFDAAKITPDDASKLCDRIYHTQCCRWAIDPDLSMLAELEPESDLEETEVEDSDEDED